MMTHAPSLGRTHEGSHQKGGLGGACADGGGDGNARHRRRHLLLAVKPRFASESVLKQSRKHPFSVTLDCFTAFTLPAPAAISPLRNMEPISRRTADSVR